MRRALIAAVALAVIVPTGAAAGVFVPGTKKPAPALAGIDPVTGKKVSLTQWKGRPVVVNLWGSWCRPCRAEAKELRTFLARHPGSLLGIDVEDAKAGAKAFQQRYMIRFPSIFDPRDVMVNRLEAYGTPSTYFALCHSTPVSDSPSFFASITPAARPSRKRR